MSGAQMMMLGSGVAPMNLSLTYPLLVLASRTGSGTLTSPVQLATVTGGLPPYSYSWTYVSGSSFTINSPSSSSTTWTNFMVGVQDLTGTYRCTITDQQGISIHTDFGVELISN